MCDRCGATSRGNGISRRVVYYMRFKSKIHHVPRYRCVVCGRSQQEELEDAPYHSKYSWEVIEKAVEYVKAGKLMSEVGQIMAGVHGIYIPPSSLKRMIQVYGVGYLETSPR